MRAVVGVGSNLGDPEANCREAVATIDRHPDCVVETGSHLYRTEPWGDTDQPAFINAVVHLQTQLAPLELLQILQAIEHQMGRRRSERRWGPRLIDLDILLVGDTCLDTDELVLPHPRMHERAFVLEPLIELDPSCMIPGRGAAVQCLLELAEQGVQQLSGTVVSVG